MRNDLLRPSEGSLSDIIYSHHKQLGGDFNDPIKPSMGAYLIRNHFYDKQWLYTFFCIKNTAGLAAARALTYLARLGDEQVPTADQFVLGESDTLDPQLFLNHLHAAFKHQQIVHHTYLDRNDKLQIDNVRAAYASSLFEGVDASEFDSFITEYYYQLLHQEN